MTMVNWQVGVDGESARPYLPARGAWLLATVCATALCLLGPSARPALAAPSDSKAGGALKVGVPTIAANEPLFGPRRYWCGPVWVIINWIIGLGGTVIGIFIKSMLDSINDLQKSDKEMADRVGSIEVLVAGTYVKRDELRELMRKLEQIVRYGG